MPSKSNIILIGMPGAGKSVLGKKLAKKMAMDFLDVDEYIEMKEDKKLQEIINQIGDTDFVEMEKNKILELDLSNHIISTGGSVVLREETMNHLRNLGLVVFLDVYFDILEKRLKNVDVRGIVGLASGLTLKNIFQLRAPLYQKYADLVVNTSSRFSIDGAVDLLEKEINQI